MASIFAKGRVIAEKAPEFWQQHKVKIIVIIAIVIAIIIGVSIYYKDTLVSKFTSTFMSTPNLKEFDIVMFMIPTCPYCKKMIEVLKNEGQYNNVTIVDVTKKEGADFAKQFGADKQPVPSFISRKLQSASIGYKPTVQELLTGLQTKRPPQLEGNSTNNEPVNPLAERARSLQLILFAREGCGWCTKAKESINSLSLGNSIQIIDIMSQEGRAVADQLLPPGTQGVPIFYSMSTKKHIVGFKPLEDIMNELS